jgi:RIO kinase 1
MNFGFEPTRFEQEWLPGSIGDFYEDEWFTSVLYRVKGGKEATVYCCEAHPSTGLKLLAAKVYRPHKFRAMRNDAVYREGRQRMVGVDSSSGSAKVFYNAKRLKRAFKKKSKWGRQAQTMSWIDHEYQTLSVLHEAGADVPKPLTQGENAILMEYLGDAEWAAPTLHEVSPGPEEARRLFGRLMENVRLFLSRDRVHADLSAFNVLYWEGAFKVIDFPQAVDPVTNPHAFNLLVRDVERLCQYFAKYGIEASAVRLAEDLWRRYRRNEL